MAIHYCYEASVCNALEILLRLFVDEVAAQGSPTLCFPGQGHGAGGGQFEIEGSTEAEVGEELEVADAVGAELQGGDGQAVLGSVFHGDAVGCKDVGWERLRLLGSCWWGS